MRLLFDCDTGIDDTMALLYLLSEPSCDLIGVTTVSGNVSSAQAARNTLDVLALAGRSDVPVAIGAHDPLAGAFHGGAQHVHGFNGIGDVSLPMSAAAPVAESAAEFIVRSARERPGEVHLLGVGPLTNLALALELEPDLPGLVEGVTIMGGTAFAPGNISPVAEANVGNDPEAAAKVFDAPWPLTMVGLDATMSQTLSENDRQQLLAAPTPAARALGEILDFYMRFYELHMGVRQCALHDPLAAAVALGTTRVELGPVVRVQVDATTGPGRGQTICDMRGLYRGYPPVEGAHTRVVLKTAGRFADDLLARVMSIGAE